MAAKRKRTTVKRKTVKAKRRPNPSYTVLDRGSKVFTKTKSKKSAQIIARVIGGRVDGAKKKNPVGLPVGKMITVKARRRKDGRIEIFKAR